MPGKVRVKLLAARNLPIMDRASEACDAFGEVRLGNTCFKTEICRKSLNPQWNSDWFRFEVDDEDLQDEPLQIRIMDYDTYSANDAIGKVYVGLNPLLGKEVGSTVSGWLPIYDTMHGIRGEVNVVVKIDLFTDANRYRESSCGVRFFYSTGIPEGYNVQTILGFVEELVVNDDPEYKWIDKIRTPRASNEARQTLFSKLSGQVQRRIGHKALELGGNAVLGYQQCFDLEGESGVVVRGIGTVAILRCSEPTQPACPTKQAQEHVVITHESPEDGSATCTPQGGRTSPLCSRAGLGTSLQQRASDPDLRAAPVPLAACTSSGSSSSGSAHRPQCPRWPVCDGLDMLEYPFLTVKELPGRFIQRIGGVVSARSVKLLDQINSPDEPETRDAWWTELRKEIRSHTRSLCCNIVLGYSETTNICEEVVVLSASGTAVLLRPAGERESLRGCCPCCPPTSCRANATPHAKVPGETSIEEGGRQQECRMCHIPYSESAVPFRAQLAKCALCRHSKVPDILFTTIEPPAGIPILGKSCFIQARVCKPKRDLKGEQNAKDISDSLPFLEFELHRQLLSKLKAKGLNGIFGLKVQVAIGEKLITGIATGTGVCLTALPSPHPTRHSHREQTPPICEPNGTAGGSDTSEDEAEDAAGGSVLPRGGACVVELDDAEDTTVQLKEPRMPEGFVLCNTQWAPGVDTLVCNLQLFMQMYRAKLFPGLHPSRILAQHFDHILQNLFVKIRKLVPCCLMNLTFHMELPEQDELQVMVVGTAVGTTALDNVRNCVTGPGTKSFSSADSADQELIFSMDEERDHSASGEKPHKPKTVPLRSKLQQQHFGRHGIDITSLNHVPGARIEKYLGNLDFFFIREETSMREEGGLNGFVHSLMTEVLAIVRAHVSSLGGNALVAFRMSHCILLHSLHKNQGQCLVSVAGDAVRIAYSTPNPEPTAADGGRRRSFCS